MSSAAAAIAVALLVGVAVVAVAWPFLSPERGRPEDRLSDEDRRRIELLERRDAVYASLRDLEQDHRTGKVNGDDYADERAHLRQEAATVLRMLDDLELTDVKADQEA
jgi:hypothetical protein